MRKLFLFILVVVFSPLEICAQGVETDFQFRIPTHIQILNSEVEAKHRFGVATWGIFPDVTAEKSHSTTLVVGGLLWQHNKKNWVEFMAGSRFNQSGYVDPILNLRLVNNEVPGLSLFGEIQQSLREERRRTLYWLSVTTPIHLGNILVGVETENVDFWRKPNSLGLGPEVIVPVPMKLPLGAKLSLVSTYQFRSDRDFMRVYLVTNFRKDVGGK